MHSNQIDDTLVKLNFFENLFFGTKAFRQNNDES